jgi:hypothetical protein
MTLKKYLILMSICTLFCWLAWVLVINYIDPTETGVLGFVFFYSSLFLAVLGTMSVFGFAFRMKIFKDELVYKQVGTAFRQAVMFGVLVVGSLFLQSKSLLTWWNIILFVLALTVLEFFFISYKKR